MNRIYYFTGTGNSFAIARRLSEKTDAQLISISKVGDADSVTGSTIGIVFPIYMYNAPRIVYRFIKKIRSCDYLYIVMTMGGGSGKTTGRIKSIAAANRLQLGAGFSIKMPDNYIAWNGAPEQEKQQELFAAAEAKIPHIVDIVTKKQRHFDNEKEWKTNDSDSSTPFPFNILPQWATQLFFDMGFRFINRLDDSFVADNRCNGCGICAKICPVNNIGMSDKKPVWQHRCEQCFACLQWCPQEAIQYGKKSVGRKRYHHPEVTVKEMAG